MYPSGYVKSTAEDMLPLWELFSNHHPQVLTQENIDAMMFPHIQMQPGIYYGYGWMVSPDYFGTTLIEHSGGIKGASASFAILLRKASKESAYNKCDRSASQPYADGGLKSQMKESQMRVIFHTAIMNRVKQNANRWLARTPARKAIEWK